MGREDIQGRIDMCGNGKKCAERMGYRKDDQGQKEEALGYMSCATTHEVGEMLLKTLLEIHDKIDELGARMDRQELSCSRTDSKSPEIVSEPRSSLPS